MFEKNLYCDEKDQKICGREKVDGIIKEGKLEIEKDTILMYPLVRYCFFCVLRIISEAISFRIFDFCIYFIIK